MSEIHSASKYQVEDDVRRATSWQELEARAEKLEKVLRLVVVEYERDTNSAISLRAEKAIRAVLGEGGWGGVK